MPDLSDDELLRAAQRMGLDDEGADSDEPVSAEQMRDDLRAHGVDPAAEDARFEAWKRKHLGPTPATTTGAKVVAKVVPIAGSPRPVRRAGAVPMWSGLAAAACLVVGVAIYARHPEMSDVGTQPNRVSPHVPSEVGVGPVPSSTASPPPSHAVTPPSHSVTPPSHAVTPRAPEPRDPRQLRQRAFAACDAGLWGECLADLDRAKSLDRAGDADPRVQDYRRRIRRGNALLE